MVPPFKTIWWKKRRNSPKTIPFKTINPVRWNLCLLRMVWAIWTPDPCCLMNLTYLRHPYITPIITPKVLFTQITIMPHLQHHSHPENHPWNPAQRTSHLKAGKDISLNQLSSDLVTLTENSSHGLSALLAEMSPLAPYRIQQQVKVKAQEKISTQKWLLSRPS